MADADLLQPDTTTAKPAVPEAAKQKPAPKPPSPVLSGATQGFGGGLDARLAQDRADIDAKTPQMPVLQKPPSQQANTDPFAAFGQPAMFIATLGSLFTRRPFVNAIQAAGGVLTATAQKDAQIAQHNFDTWKTETENAMKMAKYQQDAYNAAIKKLDVDAKAGRAELETHIAAFKDEVLQQAYAHGGIAEVKNLLFARKKSTDAAGTAQPKTAAYLGQQVDMVKLLSSDDPVEQAKGAVLQTEMDAATAHGVKGDPAAKIAADNNVTVAKVMLARIEAGDQGAYEAMKQRFGITGTWKAPTTPGSNSDQMAKVAASIKAAHPDWDDGQVTLEARKQMREATDVAGVSDENAKMLAKLWVSGNTAAAQGYSRSKADKEKIGNAIAQEMQERGMNADDINQAQLAFKSQMSEAVREGGGVGTRVAAIEVSAGEAQKVFKLVDDAYGKLPRGDFKPYNELRSLVAAETNTPEQKAAQAADFGAITTMARALNPSGVPREADIAELGRLLSTQGDSPAAHAAVIAQWNQEIAAIQAATGEARDSLRSSFRTNKGLGGGANTVRTLRAGHEDEDYNALPPGSVFIGPDGQQRRKP
jgi:hypothetical protein